jgi:hypothetical protein
VKLNRGGVVGITSGVGAVAVGSTIGWPLWLQIVVAIATTLISVAVIAGIEVWRQIRIIRRNP